MALPRSKYVKEGQEGVYHCFSRCVRRAFLCGFDALTGRDFSHRKTWLVERLRFLAAIFAIEVCAYAVMETHYHTILRTRPDIVATWSDREVATRWLTLFPRNRGLKVTPGVPNDEDISALVDCPERIAELRRRLCSLSWFMGRLNEFMAREANKEDKVKGRFWESRFKCQALLDEAAIAACMVYVDLNPIRAGMARTPEDSDFTSIQERIRAWQRDAITTAFCHREAAHDTKSVSSGKDLLSEDIAPKTSGWIPECIAANGDSSETPAPSTIWLCPIASDAQRRGILQITEAEYFHIVDVSGRMARLDKRGAVDLDLAPILLRIGANPEAWSETISEFGSKFRLAAGLISNLRNFADQIGNRWLKGLAAARSAFAEPASQST
jgi:REP element-mobilizing transposase RayT